MNNFHLFNGQFQRLYGWRAYSNFLRPTIPHVDFPAGYAKSFPLELETPQIISHRKTAKPPIFILHWLHFIDDTEQREKCAFLKIVQLVANPDECCLWRGVV